MTDTVAWMSTAEVQDFLEERKIRVSMMTIRTWIKNGTLQGKQIGNRWYAYQPAVHMLAAAVADGEEVPK